LKAYKLNLKEYKVKRTKIKDGKPEEVDEDYGIKRVIPNIMCHPSLKHNGFRFHTVAQLASKIEKCKDKHIVLDKADYEIIKKCFDDFTGFGKNDAEMVSRIYDIEEIEVAEKKRKK